MIKAIFIIALACLIISGITTLIASMLEEGNEFANSLIALRNATNTIGLVAIVIILISSFIGGRRGNS